MVHRAGRPSGRGGRTGYVRVQRHGGGTGLDRSHGSLPRADPVVSRHGWKPRRRHRRQVRKGLGARASESHHYIDRRKGYDYRQHGKKDAEHLDFVTDDVVESFGILGEPEQHVEKLKALEEAGVTQFTIYLMNTEEERIVAEYGDKIIPRFR